MIEGILCQTKSESAAPIYQKLEFKQMRARQTKKPSAQHTKAYVSNSAIEV